MTDRPAYSAAQIALHWLVAVLVVATWLTHEGMGGALRARMQAGEVSLGSSPLHVWLGLSVLALVVVRLVLRLVRGWPAPLATSPIEARAATWGHWLLYVLLVGVPAGGTVVWFLGQPSLGEVHELGGNVLLILAGGHAALALGHHYIRKDGTLRRMLRPAP